MEERDGVRGIDGQGLVEAGEGLLTLALTKLSLKGIISEVKRYLQQGWSYMQGLGVVLHLPAPSVCRRWSCSH